MTQNRTREKFELYILSLWLLFVLIIVVTVDIPICSGSGCRFIGWTQILLRNWIPLLSAALLMLGGLYYLRFDYKIAGSTSIPVSISDVEDLNYEHLTFLTTYIIPLICFNLDSVRYAAALGLLLIIIGVIYVRTDKFYANPTLALLGFNLYHATVTRRTGRQARVVLVTRDRLQSGSDIQFLELDERVYFAKERANGA